MASRLVAKQTTDEPHDRLHFPDEDHGGVFKHIVLLNDNRNIAFAVRICLDLVQEVPELFALGPKIDDTMRLGGHD